MPSMPPRRAAVLALATLAALLPARALASFHLMQIEQAVGGVCGDVGAQAVQLRMRASLQDLVSFSRIRAWDAAGTNPVVIVDMETNVAEDDLGDRILIATAGFPFADPGLAADFTMTAPIPAAYLPAGKLTFEDDGGSQVLWALAWGGAAYTGGNSGTMDNDADGVFNPAFAGVLPWSTDQAVLFDGAANDPSTTNAADYVFSASPATFTNNAGTSRQVARCIFGDGFEVGTDEAWSEP